MKYPQPISTHHKIPESWGGNLKPNNIIRLKENVHRALHTLYENDTPIQRLRRTLEVDKTAMNPDIYSAISRTLKRFEGLIEIESYELDSFNPDIFIHQLNK